MSLEDYDNLNEITENYDKGHPNKLYYLATLIYEYIEKKKGNKSTHNNNTNTSKLNGKFIESNYEPDTMELCETMEHTLDNIMNKENI